MCRRLKSFGTCFTKDKISMLLEKQVRIRNHVQPLKQVFAVRLAFKIKKLLTSFKCYKRNLKVMNIENEALS